MKKYFMTLGILSLTLISVLSLSSCSVAKAAKSEGVSATKLQTYRTRGQVLSSGAYIVTSERDNNGDLVEVYQIKYKQGSTGRAVMHGLLDVCTYGLWEIAGTPMESSNESEIYCVRVFYDDHENIKKVEYL